MNKALLALYLERGRLQERIAQQRTAFGMQLGTQLVPLQNATVAASKVLAAGRMGFEYLRVRPWVVAGVLAAVFVLRPKGSFLLARRAWVLWRGWRVVGSFASGSALAPLFKLIWQRYTNR